MSDYGDFRKSISPAWLQGRFGAGWADALGQLQDVLADATKAAVKARFPLLAPPDALEQTGVERQMPRGPNESDTSYAGRLRAAWDTWQNAGTAFGLLSALAAAGYTPEVRIQNAVRYSLDAAGKLVVEQRAAGEWWIDSQRSFWSRFVVLLRTPFPWSGVVPADGSNYQRQVSALVNRWKPAHATCTDIFLIPSGRTWDSYPTGATWDAQQRATWDSDLAAITRWSP